MPLRLKKSISQKAPGASKKGLSEKKWMLKPKLEGGDERKIEAAVQWTLGWLEATIEIDSLFEGIDYSDSLS